MTSNGWEGNKYGQQKEGKRFIINKYILVYSLENISLIIKKSKIY
jgi:hypothetical protein